MLVMVGTTSTFLGLINPNKVVEVANVHDNDTVIIRRGFTLNSGECSRQDFVSLIEIICSGLWIGITKIDSLDSISNLKSKSSSTQFSPIWLKNTYIPKVIYEHLGIVKVSNSNMEAKNPYYFKITDALQVLEEEGPNELKHYVGYLNVDYR
ncbi:AEL_HP2_G0008450.mRNA.1.CDS.1 [Saccharomyces cerevisiae]|nr:AEL_HP2_G0008450.mRNA.1.CDS.1 [Saccharomyces cerevisiae]CAI6427070.1 AEL_HP2_G0008450.mRNA.1.CDS.1 [Saccharomyces cerevisiae]